MPTPPLIRERAEPGYFASSGADRILLLGESVYTRDDGDYPADKVRDMIRATVDGAWRRRNNFYQRIYRLMTGLKWQDSAPADRIAFWDRSAFYNYVQRPVRGGARTRPDAAMWADAADRFREVFDRLAPAGVVVLGKAIRKHLVEDGLRRPAQLPGGCELAITGHHCPAVVVNHPSSQRLSATDRVADRDAVARFLRDLRAAG